MIKFVNAKYDSVVPGPSDLSGGDIDPESIASSQPTLDGDFVSSVNAKIAEYREYMDTTKLRNGLATVMTISSRGNQYLQESGLDNTLLAKQPERCAQVLLNAINLIYLLSVIVHPFMPTTAEGILRQLNAPARSLPHKLAIDILPGHKLGKAEHLFKKIENVNGEQEKAWQKRFGGDAVIAEKVVPAGPGGHPEGGAVPKVSDIPSGDKKAAHEAKKAQIALEKRAEKAAAKNVSPEEKELESKIQAQGKLVASIKTGKMEGDAEVAMATAKELKAELAELRKRLKEATI